MKRIFTSVFMGLALTFPAVAQDRSQNDNNMPTVRRGNTRSQQTVTAPAKTTARTMARPAGTQRSISTAPVRQRTYSERSRANANANVGYNNASNARFRKNNARVTSQGRVQSNVTVDRERNFRRNRERNVTTNREETFRENRERNFDTNRERNFAANRDRNMRFNQRSNVTVNRNRNVVVTNNWRGNQFGGRQYAVFRNYQRQWHDRDWWRHHYAQIIFVSGGWWYWDAGYWFPAWGYDRYAYYPYDGPIYSYSNLTPVQVVSEVQAQLRADGYYAGPIDGVLGPMTRQAIADFQADNGLAITSTVDEPTLNTLGIS
jgi:peptidoglycan hydrolase-like protein with peptidoglycan-binding domain